MTKFLLFVIAATGKINRRQFTSSPPRSMLSTFINADDMYDMYFLHLSFPMCDKGSYEV